MVQESGKYWLLDSACPAIANSFAGQVGMLDVIRNFFLFIQNPVSGIALLQATGYLGHQPFEYLRAVSLSNGSSA
jgi:hypothetical protein